MVAILLELVLVLLQLGLYVKRTRLRGYLLSHDFKLFLVLLILLLFYHLDVLPELLLHVSSFLLEPAFHFLSQAVELHVIFAGNFPLLRLQSLDIALVRVKSAALLFLELLQFEFVPLLLSLLDCFPNACVLLLKGFSLPFELFLHILFILAQLLVTFFLHLESLPLLFLSQLLFEESDLGVYLLLEFCADLALLLSLILLPLLLLGLDLLLVLPENLSSL